MTIRQLHSHHDSAKTLDHLGVILELTSLDVNPANPIAAGQDDAARVEGRDGAGFFNGKRAHGRVGGEAGLPSVGLIAGRGGQSPFRCFLIPFRVPVPFYSPNGHVTLPPIFQREDSQRWP